MAVSTSTGGVRQSVTRVLAAGALLGLYCMSTLAVTGALMTATSTTAEARGGRGWRGGRGFRGGRGWRGSRRWVCRHHHWSSARRCFWVW
jgi:hypothetical protein